MSAFSNIPGKCGWFLVKALALLPLGALYIIADVIYFLAYHVTRYRTRVVKKHIADAFPELDESQRKRIIKDFYHNFADYIVETIKLAHISDDEMRRRMTFTNTRAITDLTDRGIPVMVLFSHCFNWEWAPSVTMWLDDPDGKIQFGQVYRPLKNKWMDERMLSLRSRFGSLSYPMMGVLRSLLTARREGKVTVTGFMSDQKPIWGDVRHVINFFNHPTPVLLGSEEMARKLKMGVVYWDMTKKRRGHYNIDMITVTDNADTIEQEWGMTDRYFELLTQTVRRQPALWLWSHKRWKYPYRFLENGEPVYHPTSVR